MAVQSDLHAQALQQQQLSEQLAVAQTSLTGVKAAAEVAESSLRDIVEKVRDASMSAVTDIIVCCVGAGTGGFTFSMSMRIVLLLAHSVDAVNV